MFYNSSAYFKSLKNLVGLIILNCLGSGLLILPPRLAQLGISCFYSWVFTGLGAFGIGMIFVRLCEESGSRDSSIQNLLSFQFTGRLRRFIRAATFWGYWLFAVLGNAVFSVAMLNSLVYFFPTLNRFEMYVHIATFALFFVLNRFGIGMSRAVSNLLCIIKIVIMVLLPIAALILIPTNLPIAGNSISIKQIMGGMFITLWPFLGIESIVMEKNVDLRAIRPAMTYGVFICLLTYIINTYVMMKSIPNLGTCASPYGALFSILFGRNMSAAVSIATIMIVAGSLHGWTGTVTSTCESGAKIVPQFLQKHNRHKVPERALGMSSIIPVIFLFIVRFVLKSENAFDVILDVATGMCLVIYASAVALFLWYCISRKKVKVEDVIYLLLGISYSILAVLGSPFLINVCSVAAFALLGAPYLIRGGNGEQ